ncbi:hypothetical protein BGW80DRAFT_1563227 [Lactifluus volemus]|nr:hypothetical protein BGW80DRAFT_1563227 [Lactifluus volemus]
MQMDGLSIGSNNKNIVACRLIQQQPNQVVQRVTIGSLPDNVLLEIFDLYINTVLFKEAARNWEKLVHICRRWRYIIFESPIRLNLQLFCTKRSPVRELLDIWPPFPLIIQLCYGFSYDPGDSTDILIAALERRDRIREIQVHISDPQDDPCEQIITAMGEPFPALRSLSFKSFHQRVRLDTLLNGSAPCLRDLSLRGISFPSLPQLLSSASDLTSLRLDNIPKSGYIPPEIMATSLSALPKLKSLTIDFDFPTSHPERRNRAPPPLTRFVLPALTSILFCGVSEYLEVLAARFDAPLLNEFNIRFFHRPVFYIPQTVRFLSCLDSFNPSSQTLTINLWGFLYISLDSNTTHHFTNPPILSWHIMIMCIDPDSQVDSVTQICSQILPFRSSVTSLIIKYHGISNLDPTPWLQLFHSFPAVQSLQIPVELQPFVTSVLEGPREESLPAAEVFPLLHSLSIVGLKPGESVQQPIQSSFRRRSGCTVAVSRTCRDD